MQERGQEHPIRGCQPRPVELPLQDGKLVAQRQDLDVFLGAADRQQSDHGEHARDSQVGQSQQHDK